MKKLLMLLGFSTSSATSSLSLSACYENKKLELKYFFLNSNFIHNSELLIENQSVEYIKNKTLYNQIANQIISEYNSHYQDKLQINDFDFASASINPKPWLIKIYNGDYNNEANLITYYPNNNNLETSFKDGLKNDNNSLSVKILTKDRNLKGNLNTNPNGIVVYCYFEQFIYTSKNFIVNKKIKYDLNNIPTIDTLKPINAIDVSSIFKKVKKANTNANYSSYKGIENQSALKISKLLGSDLRNFSSDSLFAINSKMLNHIIKAYNNSMLEIINLRLKKEINLKVEERKNKVFIKNNYASFNSFKIYTKQNNIVSILGNEEKTIQANSGIKQEVYARFYPSTWALLDEEMISADENASFYLYLGTIQYLETME